MTLQFLDIMVAALILIVLGSAPFQFKLLLYTTSLINQTASSSPFLYTDAACYTTYIMAGRWVESG